MDAAQRYRPDPQLTCGMGSDEAWALTTFDPDRGFVKQDPPDRYGATKSPVLLSKYHGIPLCRSSDNARHCGSGISDV
jgi:hypothetical protein